MGRETKAQMLKRLERRYYHLVEKTDSTPKDAMSFDKAEAAALRWAIDTLQASYSSAVLDGEKAAEEHWKRLGNTCDRFPWGDVREAYLAGFQAHSPLVGLLRDCRHTIEALKTTQKDTGLGPLGELIGEDLLARIDATLEGK